MTRVPERLAAACAAVLLMLVSFNAILVVPEPALASAAAPALA